MAKTISLPETVYADLVAISDELTLMAKKPISLSMTAHLLTAVYHAHMNNPCTLDAFSQQLASLEILSPEEFDKVWDDLSSRSTNQKRRVKPAKKITPSKTTST